MVDKYRAAKNVPTGLGAGASAAQRSAGKGAVQSAECSQRALTGSGSDTDTYRVQASAVCSVQSAECRVQQSASARGQAQQRATVSSSDSRQDQIAPGALALRRLQWASWAAVVPCCFRAARVVSLLRRCRAGLCGVAWALALVPPAWDGTTANGVVASRPCCPLPPPNQATPVPAFLLALILASGLSRNPPPRPLCSCFCFCFTRPARCPLLALRDPVPPFGLLASFAGGAYLPILAGSPLFRPTSAP